jgi:hypothetical protein
MREQFEVCEAQPVSSIAGAVESRECGFGHLVDGVHLIVVRSGALDDGHFGNLIGQGTFIVETIAYTQFENIVLDTT